MTNSLGTNRNSRFNDQLQAMYPVTATQITPNTVESQLPLSRCVAATNAYNKGIKYQRYAQGLYALYFFNYLPFVVRYQIPQMMNTTAPSANGIQSGDNTQSQLQAITPASLRPMNSTNKSVGNKLLLASTFKVVPPRN